MKKWLVSVLALALTLSLAACGKSDAAKAVDDQITALGTVTLDSGAAITAAEQALAALEEKDAKQVENAAALTAARETYERLVLEDKAAKVEEVIRAIGTVTVDSQKEIDAAQAAYDAAPADVKALVKNAGDIETARGRLLQAKADEVAKVIAAIGAVTEDSEKAITAAQKAFDAAAPEVQALVQNAGDIEKARTALSDLRVGNVKQLIDSIGTVTLDSGEAIKAAEDAYKKLSADDKKKVTNYDVLTAASTEVKALKQAEAEKILAGLKLDNDKVRGIKWYYAKTYQFYSNGTWAADKRCFVLPYLGQDAKSTWMRLVFDYTGSEWIFFKKVTVAADDQRFTKTFSYFDIERDNSGYRVWEYIDVDGSSYEEMLWAIANSKETIVRFEGDAHYYDATISDADKAAIREVLTAYDLLKS